MIKKFLLGIGIGLLTFIGFSNAASFTQQFNLNQTIQLNDRYQVGEFILKPGTNFYFNNGGKVFGFAGYGNNNSTRNHYLFWHDNKLYGLQWVTSVNSIQRQGYIYYFCKLNREVSIYDDILPLSRDGNCLTGEKVSGSSFYDIDQGSAKYMLVGLDSANYFNFCFVYNGVSYCSVPSSNYLLSGSLDLPVPNTSSLADLGSVGDNLISYYGSSPFSYSNPTPNYTPDVQTTYTDLDRYIDYYETRYGRDINMCYVGTNDLISPYGTTGINFEVGTGKLIYELYYSLYSGFGSNKIKNVGKFVNSWLINYSQWFYDGKRYLVTDNGPDTNITVRYENLTPPFTNQPVAIYFMASNLFDTYVRESTQGEEIVYYCDLKVNYNFYKANEDEFEETVDKTDKNITDRVKDYFNSQIVNGSGKVGFVVPNLSGSVWGETSSGNVLPEDLNPTSLFKDFFARITTLYSNFDYSTNPILPAWIVYPLIFLVLFRIFRH